MMKSILLLALSAFLCTVYGEYFDQECEPGSRWDEDCNTCFCTANKVKSCTKKLCPTQPPPGKAPRPTCKPGSTFKKDCNTCTCDEFGTGATCTLRACAPTKT